MAGLPLLVLADDLSGAAEVAGTLGQAGLHVQLEAGGLGKPAPRMPTRTAPDAIVIDLNSRDMDPEARGAASPIDTVGYAAVFVKIDSQLRGDIDAMLGLVADVPGPILLCPAVPRLGRTVENGAVLTASGTLSTSPTWRAAPDPPPRTIADTIRSVPTRRVSTADLRGGRLPAIVSDCGDERIAVIIDAVHDGDLDLVAAAGLATGAPFAGAGGLASAVARHVAATRRFRACRTMVVIGSREPHIAAQIAVLVDHGFKSVTVAPDELLADGGARQARVIAEALDDGDVVVAIGDSTIVPASSARLLPGRLAELCAHVDGDVGPIGLVLTGGATARAVFERFRIQHAVPLGTAGHGAVVLRAGDRVVATRPGSFGDDRSLLAMAEAVRWASARAPASPDATTTPVRDKKGSSMSTHRPDPQPDVATGLSDRRPVIAVTMGDGAGVGPEVTVAAVTDPMILDRCQPLVIGDAERLARAAEALDVRPEIVPITSVSEVAEHPGAIHVIDLGLLPRELPWGEVSAVAGDAAFHYVRIACDLVRTGDVQAICTAPLNKEALHAGGHQYPGHTEILAELTGTKEVSMMLATPKVKVIHVTTHLGLLDAIDAIEPGIVERTIRRGHDAMVQFGIGAPRIGVCAINPHAGENGLFGHREEEQKIAPGIAAARAAGVDVHGPLPADTAFFLAGRGDYDLIVAMYHDQGHGPIKVLGIEAGVNITVGLPVIRTSVDHGTAFDIAGTGTVDTRSMVEALRQAALFAPSVRQTQV